MLLLQLNEATAAQRRIPFYAVDITDGFTPETGLSSFVVDVSENGGARAAGAGSDPTEIDATNMPGYYYYEATAAELSTLGFLAISIKHASMRDFLAIAQVVAFDPYSATDLGLTNLNATISSRSSHSEADVWTTGSRELSTPANYMADVSAIISALPTNYIMGSSDQTDKDDEIDAIYNKLPIGDLLDAIATLSAMEPLFGATPITVTDPPAPTTTTFRVTAGPDDTDDHYNGQIVIFTSGSPLFGQARYITDYDGTNKDFTVYPPFTDAPVNGNDGYIIAISRIPDTIYEKLPTNYIMGSSVVTDKDGVIDGIDSKTTNLPADPASETNVDATEVKVDAVKAPATTGH